MSVFVGIGIATQFTLHEINEASPKKEKEER
jgi:hypothetical protein